MNRCMAAASFYLHQSRALAAANHRFLLFTNLSISKSPSSFLLPTRRAVHNSVYDKNPEDQAVPTVVPDDVIQPHSDEYWAPHPKTGVFGPATEAGGVHTHTHTHTTATQDSVLEQKAFFRPLEDLEKPPPQP